MYENTNNIQTTNMIDEQTTQPLTKQQDDDDSNLVN